MNELKEPASFTESHVYNNDLLVDEGSREKAKLQFPEIFHVLCFPELQNRFQVSDQRANRAKKLSHTTGTIALAFALVASIGAATELLLHNNIDRQNAKILLYTINGICCVCGISGFLIAKHGVLYGKRKSAWLEERFVTERLRAFHFQTLIWRLSEIRDSLRNPVTGVEEYEAKRRQWLEDLLVDLDSQPETQIRELLKPNGLPNLFLHGSHDIFDRPEIPEDLDMTEIFAAYKTLRFQNQTSYVRHTLRDSQMGSGIPIRIQKRFLDRFWVNAIIVVFLTEVINLTVSSLELFGKIPFFVEHPYHHQFHNMVHFVVVMFSLLAVGVKTLAEGLGLEPEIERYEEYRIIIETLEQAFEKAITNQEKVLIMLEMEKAVYEEKRQFFRTHEEATFVL